MVLSTFPTLKYLGSLSLQTPLNNPLIHLQVKGKWLSCVLLFATPWNSTGQNTGVDSQSLFEGIFQPRDRTQVSCIAGRFFTSWATREALPLQTKIQMTAAAAAVAKLLQSCPTLCDPIDSSPPGSPVPGILQARTLEWVAISFSNAWKWKVKVKSLSRVRLLATPWTANNSN